MQSSHLFASSAIVAASGVGLQQQRWQSTSVKAFSSRRGLVQHHISLVPDAKLLRSPGFGFRRKAGTSGFRCGTHATKASAAGVASTVQERVASWESLAEKLGLEKFGSSERLANARDSLFAPEEQPKLVFYRDEWAWCPYCERVWLQLEEKKIAYTVEKISMQCYGEKPAWYAQLVPSGLLPAVMVDREVLSDSSLDIMFALEDKFPDNNPLLPERDSPEFAAMDELLKLERELFGAWLTRLTQPWKDTGAFESSMDKVNSSLEKFQGQYFLGSQFSLVDAVYAPFLERIAASMPYWTGTRIRGSDRWPMVNSWFDAMDSRPPYQAVKSDDFSITHNLESQIGPCISAEAGASYRALIDGTDGSWDLPLKPEVTAWGSDDGTGKGGAKEEAAQYLIQNHDRLVEAALREVKDREKYRASLDLGFWYLAKALVDGIDNVTIEKGLPEEVASAAAYLRDRVSVPRDLTYPAARQLRAHLNWLVKTSVLGREESLTASNGDVQLSGVSSWLYPSKDDLPDEKEMSIFDHLEELRERILVSVLGVGAAILGCFCFSKNLIVILEAPVYSQGVRFLQLSPGEYFFTSLKVSGYCGLLIGSPLILYEIIAFVVPGLTRSERRFLGPLVLGSSVLFYTGVAFSYAVLTPAALNFFVNYAEGVVESLWSIDQYFEFVLVLLFSTGLSFQVPVIQLLLGQSKLVTADQMLSIWRYVVVGAVVVAAVLTPSTDPFTQVLLAGPLIGLYMGGAFLVKFLVQEPDSS